ncbi:MAG: DNA-3-methyladenine glycosylase II, partial [bacterium P201]
MEGKRHLELDPISYLKARDERLAKVIEYIGVLKPSTYNSSNDSFLFLTREIVGQMISASVKKVILSRLDGLCHTNITAEAISELTIEQLRNIGLSKAKSIYILNLADIVLREEIDFDGLKELPDDKVLETLTSIKGVGCWTAKMYLLFFLQREDILPYEDGAFLQAYKWLYNTTVIKPESIKRKCKRWKPYT